MAIELKFEPNLHYQAEAIRAATELFAGMPLGAGNFSVATGASSQLAINEFGIGNPDPGESLEPVLLENLRGVQEDNALPLAEALDGPHFSVEMETGTGKTYVYLRTMFELHQRHGFSKFVVVVPSVAIREGVLASIRTMRRHFQALYSTPFDAAIYDSKAMGRVRNFATSNSLQILVINIQAFQKDVVNDGSDDSVANVINRPHEAMQWRRPIEFVQACRPVVIVDEPQNMESAQRTGAIDRLHPMCTLRYSATHERPYNRIYRLGPVEAHRLSLVKSIEVASVVEDENLNAAYIEVLSTDAKKSSAKLKINVGHGSGGAQKTVTVKVGDDLFVVSDERYEYRNGFIVDNIHFRDGDEHVVFSAQPPVYSGAPSGGFGDDVRRAQIRETVRQHLDRELNFHRNGVRAKVLSLFFLDKVANYRQYSDAGHELGPFAEWFEKVYDELAAKPKYTPLTLAPAADVHGGYFSRDKATKKQPEMFKDSKSGESKDDAETYELIMQDKERLLSPEVPLRFIFSHSALREGWDNPNVFQICTLNESKSKDRKRQEIGRGLRLPVDYDGNRIRDRQVNRLTVIANEAYEDFARQLQNEYEDDTGRRFGVLEKAAFVRLGRPQSHPIKPGERFGADGSAIVFDHLVTAGILSKEGEVLPAFDVSNESFVLPVPVEYEPVRDEIVAVIERHVDPVRVENARQRKPVRYRKRVTLNSEFKELWDRISKRTRYRVKLDSEALVAHAVAALADAPPIEPPKITIRVADIRHRRSGLSTQETQTKQEVDTARTSALPDILATLQNETDLTRRTLVRVLIESGRLDDFTVNPQAFVQLSSRTITQSLRAQVLSGLEYEEIAGSHWEMRRLEPEDEEAIERYASRLYEVQNQDKTPFDHVEFDSEVEHRFARALDHNDDVRFYLKLPSWFSVGTPVGPYNPDWAIMFEADTKLYLVRETKGSLDAAERRETENIKIDCATKHFGAIGVDYDIVTSMDDLAAQVS